ncbi:MAG: gliding motility-associated C-terminal domain-containing protein [Bacteroidetes bacterium]|nr:gliding motility-associated C-terminal domain-containing protein [Bacteroidota bacterium]
MSKKRSITVLIFALCFLFSGWVNGQISAPGSDAVDKTSYPTFQETDDIFIFCSEDSLANNGILRATTQITGTKTFLWEVYNNQTAAFEFYFSESSDNSYSEITGLADGGYRVTITLGANSEIYRAWVFNNWTITDAVVGESNCVSFSLSGNFTTAKLNYYDLVDNSEVEVYKNVQVAWKDGDVLMASTLNPQIFNPPTKDTDYTFRVYDKFDCEGTTNVTYESIVTKAVFSVDPDNGEAPLIVNFNNESENGDSDQYEWYLYRNLDEIKREGEDSDGPIDSIMIVAYDESPIYTYENSGTYDVKLVSKKISEFHTCIDTVYIEKYIKVDTSFVAVPNVFTPNGDGTNDNFVVQFWSMQSIKISIFNRWGKRIHFWESEDIRGFEGTWSETVWDGRIMGGRFASPGVYYYNVVGEGRDGKRKRAHGFFHLFRGKD